MPSRIIRESARTSPTLDQLSANAERLFWRLITVADDHGRFDANARVVTATAFPLKVGKLGPATVEKWLCELSSAGAVQLYEVAGRRFGVFPAWEKHQRRPQGQSKHPAPPTVEAPCQHGGGTVSNVPRRGYGVGGMDKRVAKGAGPTVAYDPNGFVVSNELLTLWKETYPALDVSQVVREAFAWAVANPQNRKSNWHRFLVNWLKREQDRAPRVVPPSPPPPRPAILDEPELPDEVRAANLRRVGEMASAVAARRAMS